MSRCRFLPVLLLALVPAACKQQTSGEQPPPVQAEPAAAAVPEAPRDPALKPSDSYYGVYLKGHKVGWMRSVVEIGSGPEALVDMRLELRASVGGLGSVSDIALDEDRSYRLKDGALVRLSFTQRAATGATEVTGEVRGAELHLQVSAGGRTSEHVVPVAEDLEDALSTVRLAAEGQVGAKGNANRFDASILKQVKVENEVMEVEQRLLGGISTRCSLIRSTYPDLGINETAWVDAEGTVLESKVGGFFVARLEPPDVAKRLDYSQDILVSAVVQAPPGMAQAVDAQRLELSFTGFGDTLPPTSDRQQVRRQGDVVHLSLKRDAPPSGKVGTAPAGDEQTAATPFIQSDAPQIRDTAKQVAGDAEDLQAAVAKLSHFVFEHVRDEYVPAYSNALEALESGRGDCTEHSILFVALARALGIPARVAVGIAYWPSGGGFGWHAWAEVRDGQRWLAVDPTWDQPIADVTHVKLADGGPAEQARIVMLLGQLQIVDASVPARGG